MQNLLSLYPDLTSPAPSNQVFTEYYKSLIQDPGNVGTGFYSCNNINHWALTFDDGPSENTMEILNQLDSRNIKATFFLIGANVKDYPNQASEIFKRGHEIGIHTWSHPYLSQLSNEQIISEVMWSYNIVKDIVGVESNLIRVPYGDQAYPEDANSRVLSILNSMGFSVIGWNSDTEDWSNNGANVQNDFQQWIETEPRVGRISLQHEQTDLNATFAGVDLLLYSDYNITQVSKCVGVDWRVTSTNQSLFSKVSLNSADSLSIFQLILFLVSFTLIL